MQPRWLLLFLCLCPSVWAALHCGDRLVLEKKQQYLGAVRRQLQTPPLHRHDWSCDEGLCHLLVPHLMTALHLYEGRTEISHVTNHVLSHTFLRDASLGVEVAIIVDPTYLQFFHPRVGELPTVFVGTRDDLVALFTLHHAHLKEDDLADYPLEELVDRLYGFGRFEETIEISRDTIVDPPN